MKKTLNDQTIDQITSKLAHFLADTFVLSVKTLNFHWNMKGAEFFMYHKLLEEQYKKLSEAIDDLAERMQMLGRAAPGSMAEFLNLACLKESSSHLTQEQMIHELVQNHEELVEHCHALIKFTDSVFDQGTSDLMIEQIRFHAKQAWLLRSHLVLEKH
jgi:starvation-inducible DNA-binding protein